MILAGHPRRAEQIAFRDTLRRNGQLADRYAELKRRLAMEHGTDREAYTAAKGELIAVTLRRQRAAR